MRDPSSKEEIGELTSSGGVDVVDGIVGDVSVAVALGGVGEAFDGVLLGEAGGGGVVPALAVLEEACGAVVEAAGGAVRVQPGGGVGGPCRPLAARRPPSVGGPPPSQRQTDGRAF